MAAITLITGFNTQPPEGGWRQKRYVGLFGKRFNTQPPEGGWFSNTFKVFCQNQFQHTAA